MALNDEQLQRVAERLHRQFLELDTVLKQLDLIDGADGIEHVRERLREEQDIERCQGGCLGWYRSYNLVFDEDLGADVCDSCYIEA